MDLAYIFILVTLLACICEVTDLADKISYITLPKLTQIHLLMLNANDKTLIVQDSYKQK